MRHPSSLAALYAWHTKRLAGGAIADEVAPFVNEPQCGWYKRQLVKRGPFVPVRIWMDREIDPDTGELLSDEMLRCETGGERRDPDAEWNWCWCNPISEQEHAYMVKLAYHASFYEPNSPEANPRKPIDWASVQPPTFNRSK